MEPRATAATPTGGAPRRRRRPGPPAVPHTVRQRSAERRGLEIGQVQAWWVVHTVICVRPGPPARPPRTPPRRAHPPAEQRGAHRPAHVTCQGPPCMGDRMRRLRLRSALCGRPRSGSPRSPLAARSSTCVVRVRARASEWRCRGWTASPSTARARPVSSRFCMRMRETDTAHRQRQSREHRIERTAQTHRGPRATSSRQRHHPPHASTATHTHPHLAPFTHAHPSTQSHTHKHTQSQ